VITADNGMPFPRCKGQVYEYSNHLPLAVMWKRGIRNPGRRVDEFVSFVDLAPTFLDLAGLTPQCVLERRAYRSVTTAKHTETHSCGF
jgi:arylsulfatase A-like enzyme